MLIAAFFIFFFFAFVYVRLDFSISKDEGQEVKLKVSGLCEKICANQVRKPKVFPATDVFKKNRYCLIGSPLGQL